MPIVVSPHFQEADVQSSSFAQKQPCVVSTPPKLNNIPTFQIKDTFIAYASPDSTYAVTSRMINGAKRQIIIGIYDFSADHIKQLLISARNRGVEVLIMLDLRKGEKDETRIYEELQTFGCKIEQAPSCGNRTAKFFHSCHEKIIVIDGEWTLIQSGNYSVNSIPPNNEDGGNPTNFITGNRDMGIAIRSAQLSDFFSNLIKSDIELQALSITSTEPEFLEEIKSPNLVELAPQQLPLKLFPSKRLEPKKEISVRPILTPDNYMEEIPEILSKAQKSIYIENQYIRGQQPEVSKLLEAIKKAKENNSRLDVRIILGKIFGKDDVVKEQTNLAHIESLYGLALDKNIRYIDTTRFVHCHNKLIIVDEKSVLVSSQNWSDAGVSTNREAGLYIVYKDLAKYYSSIFESDWLTAQKTIPMPASNTISSVELASGKFIRVVAADHIEV